MMDEGQVLARSNGRAESGSWMLSEMNSSGRW